MPAAARAERASSEGHGVLPKDDVGREAGVVVWVVEPVVNHGARTGAPLFVGLEEYHEGTGSVVLCLMEGCGSGEHACDVHVVATCVHYWLFDAVG